MEIKLNSQKGEYSIHISEGIISQVDTYVKKYNPKKVFIVTDSNVYPLYFDKIKNLIEKQDISVSFCILPAGEGSKSAESLFKLYSECIRNSITRSDLIIALGGGVVGDVRDWCEW